MDRSRIASSRSRSALRRLFNAAQIHRPRMQVEGLEQRVLMSAGQLDPTFGSAGKELLPLPGGSSAYVVAADATQADGKIVLLESAPQSNAPSPFHIQRLNVNGSLDPSFGAGGIVASGFDGYANSLVIQPDGRIVVGGAAGNRVYGGGGVDGPSFLARFNTNGSPDATFGNGGTIAIQVPGQTGFDAVALAPGGKLVEVGHAPAFASNNPVNEAQVFYAARYNPDGSLDASFNGTGYVHHQLQQDVFPGPYETLAVAVQPDGKVLVGSGLKNSLAVWRYMAGGSLDLSFGEGGLATTPMFFGSFNDDTYSWGSISKVIVQPNGQILVAGTENVDDGERVTWAMSRYNANGTLDSAFGDNGLVTLPGGFFGGSVADPNLPGGLALLPDGKIIIGGLATPSDSPPPNVDRGPFVVYRYLPNGFIDTSFQSTPIQFFGDTFGQIGATAVEPDGSIVIAGTVADGKTNVFPTPSNIGVARVQGGSASSQPTPFLGHPFNAATDTIYADDFDNGGQGVSYHDTTPANLGGQYRNTAVDIALGGANGYSVGYVAAGEWLDYTITVPTTGFYDFQASVAALNKGGTFHAEVDGRNLTGTLSVPNTGGWEAWQTVTATGTFLEAGNHILRVAFDSGGFYGPSCVGDFNYFKFVPPGPPAVSPTAPGHLDTGFADAGRQLINDPSPDAAPASIEHRARATAVQPDGRIIVVGSIGDQADGGSGQVWIERLNPDGSIDASFGNNGSVVTAVGAFSFATSVLVQPDGRILVGGATEDSPAAPTNSSFALLRYNPDGSLDPSFGAGGRVVTDFPGNEEVDSLAFAPGGKIVAAGSYFLYPNVGFDVARYRADGSLDATFHGIGTLRESLGPTGSNSAPAGVAVQPDGKIVVAAHAGNEPAAYRFSPDGSPDASFGNTGVATTGGQVTGTANLVLVQPDGKVVLAGAQIDGPSYDVIRLNPNGSLDTPFSESVPGSPNLPGIAVLIEPPSSFPAAPLLPPAALLLQPDGKLLLVANQTNPANLGNGVASESPLIWRLTAGGLIDPAFGQDYEPNYLPPPPFGDETTRGAALAPDGKLVIVNDAFASNTPDALHWVGVARILTGATGPVVPPPPPPPPVGPTPFLGRSFNVNTDTIYADDFDNGGEGVSYHDTTPQNIGGQYRNTAVDVTAGGANGYSVGYVVAGEWLDYTIAVPTAGTYRFQASVACVNPGGSFHAEIDGQNVSGPMKVPNTGGWEAWQTVTSGSAFTLSAGTHVLRVAFDSGGYYGPGCVGDFNYFKVVPQA